MNKKLIVVAGDLAAGKTTFALKLSKELHIPCFCKDLLKNALAAHVPVNNREDGRKLSAATFDAMAYITARFMEASLPLIIEANFVMGENNGGVKEGAVIRALAESHHYQTLTFLFSGNAKVLHRRFLNRSNKTDRRANRVFFEPTLEDFERISLTLKCFDIGGKSEKIDTTDFDKADFAHHLETARVFMGLDEVDFSLF
jgi:predicted kinase